MRIFDTRTLRGDLSGGLSSALMALPGNIIYGMIAFAPLGPAHIGPAILAGVYASVVAGFFATLFGSARAMISGPRGPTALVCGSVVGQLMASGAIQGSGGDPTSAVVALTFLTILLAGMFQALFGLLSLGKLVKYISVPVIAGIMNGTAVLIFLAAAWSCLGIPRQPLDGLGAALRQVQPLAMLVAAVAAVLWVRGPRLVPRVPGPLLSLLGGTALYYGLALAGLEDHLGGTLISVPRVVPDISHVPLMLQAVVGTDYWPCLRIVLTGALALAVFSSMESLLAVLTYQNLSDERVNGDRELVGQGIGNIANALLGAIASGGAPSRVTVNWKAGGRTRLSGISFSLISLGLILLGGRFIGDIPKAVTGGMTLVVGYLVVDKWSLRLLKSVAGGSGARGRTRFVNLGVMLLVTVAVVGYGIMTAAAVGIALSLVLFVEKMSRSSVRKTIDGSRFHSKRRRREEIQALLREHGSSIAVVQLEGALFYGAMEVIQDTVDRQLEQGASFVVLDMKRVTDVDVSSAMILGRIWSRLRKNGKTLVFSHVFPGGHLWGVLKDEGLMESIGESFLFPDTDQALEFCENTLICDFDVGWDGEEDLADAVLGAGRFSREQADALLRYMEQVEFDAGVRIFSEGDPSDAAYILIRGSAASELRVPGTTREVRLFSMGPGTILGGAALLGEQTRPYGTDAPESTECYRLSIEEFDRIKAERPDLAMLLLDAVGRDLELRLDQANRTIVELER